MSLTACAKSVNWLLKDQKGLNQALVDVCNWVKGVLHNVCDKWLINLDFSVIQIKKISLQPILADDLLLRLFIFLVTKGPTHLKDL